MAGQDEGRSAWSPLQTDALRSPGAASETSQLLSSESPNFLPYHGSPRNELHSAEGVGGIEDSSQAFSDAAASPEQRLHNATASPVFPPVASLFAGGGQTGRGAALDHDQTLQGADDREDGYGLEAATGTHRQLQEGEGRSSSGRLTHTVRQQQLNSSMLNASSAAAGALAASMGAPNEDGYVLVLLSTLQENVAALEASQEQLEQLQEEK